MSELDNKQNEINSGEGVAAPAANAMPNIADLKRPELRGASNSEADESAPKMAPPPPPRPDAKPKPVEAPVLNKAPLGFSAPSSLSMINSAPPPPPPPPVVTKDEEEPLNINVVEETPFIASQNDEIAEVKPEEIKAVLNEITQADSDDEDIFSAIVKSEQEPAPVEDVIVEELVAKPELEEVPEIVKEIPEVVKEEVKEEIEIKEEILVAAPAPEAVAKTGSSVNEITQAVFDEILRQHNEWLISEGREGRRANLHSLDLRNINFTGANLQQSNMRAVILSGVNLGQAVLIEADLTEAMLDGVQAIGANWSRINLSNANLQDANLEQTNLAYGNCFRANFYRTNLCDTNLESANLRDAILVEANLSSSYMKDAVCRGADLTQTIFKLTNLTNVDMRECLCHSTNFADCVLENTSFKNAHFENMVFTNADFTNALDIPIEYQNKGFKLEKENLEQEKTELKQMEGEIAKKQKELMEMRLQMEEQRNLIGSLKADEHVYLGSLQGILGHLKIIRAAWGVVLFLVFAITGITIANIDMDSLNMFELGIVLIVPILLILLVLYTFGQVAGARKRIIHHSMIRERKIAMLQQGGQVAENKSVQPVAVEEKISSGKKMEKNIKKNNLLKRK